MDPAGFTESLTPWSPLHLQQVLDALRSVLIAFNREDRVVMWNVAASKVTGLAAGQVIYSDLRDLDLDWDARLLESARDQSRETGGAVPIDDFLVGRRGERPRTLGATMTPIQGKGQAWIGYALIASDLTEKRQLDQRLEAVGALAAGLAHEINTPIQWLNDNLRFLQQTHREVRPLFDELDAAGERGELPPALAKHWAASRLAFLREEWPSCIDDGIDGCQRISAIVKAMKEFAHPGDAIPGPVDLEHIVESALTIARHEYKEVAEVCRDFEGLPLIPGFRADLLMVVLNLIVNAAHAIGERHAGSGTGRIVLRTYQQDEQAVLEVCDDGLGIPPEVQSRIFDPFFTTKEVGKGSGQGLPIARTAVVRKHFGTLTFLTHPGEGTTFYVRLPLVRPSDAAALLAQGTG